MPRITSDAKNSNANRCTFLDMIAAANLGADVVAASDAGYNVLQGSTAAAPLLFDDYTDHPNQVNATTGTTDAGRYLISFAAWQLSKRPLFIPDFGPLSQDKIALAQMEESGVTALVDAGQFDQAMTAWKALKTGSTE
jgi:muramidase (phage lysozyme)